LTATCPLPTHAADDVPNASYDAASTPPTSRGPEQRRQRPPTSLPAPSRCAEPLSSISAGPSTARPSRSSYRSRGGRKRIICRATASRVNVPLIRHSQLRSEAAQHGAALPRLLRPPRQRPALSSSRGGLRRCPPPLASAPAPVRRGGVDRHETPAKPGRAAAGISSTPPARTVDTEGNLCCSRLGTWATQLCAQWPD
jgi:hypothetical protein